MATTYTGLRVQDTYNAIIKIGDNTTISSTAKLLSDGLGNDSPLYLSGTRLGIGISPAYQFHTSGNAKIGGNLIISGDLTVNGTTTIIDSTIIAIGDNMIEMAKDNVANTKDIGWYGTIVESGTKYAGMAYDASTGVTAPKFNLGLGTVEPSNTFATTVIGTLVANLEGNVTGTVSSLSNHDTDNLSEGSVNLYFTTTRARASFTEGTGVTITSGEIAIGQDVGTTSNVTFGNISALGASFTDPVTIYDASLTENPRLIIGRDSSQTIEFDVVDLGGVIRHKNDSDSNQDHFLDFIIDTPSTGNNVFNFKQAGNSTSTYLTISNTGATFTGLVTGIAPTSDLNFATKKYVDDSIPVIPGTPALSAVLGAGNTSGANDIIMADSQKVFLGTDSDLEIYHDGTDGYIDNINGELIIQNNSNDKKIIFKSDNGIGDITEYFRIDGNINRNVITVTTQIGDNTQFIFGSGAGRPSIKYDSTATQLFISGNSKFLDDLYVVGDFNLAGNVTSDLIFSRAATRKIVFNSDVNFGSDNAFLYFNEDSTFHRTGTENVRFSIGAFNDFSNANTHSDALDLQGGSRLFLNVGTWDAELDTAIGVPASGASLDPYPMQFAVNNAMQLRIGSGGDLNIKGITQSNYLNIGTYSVNYINNSTLPDTPAEHLINLAPPSTANYYGGGISWSESANTAASIGVYDAGATGALGFYIATGNNTTLTKALTINDSQEILLSNTHTKSKIKLIGTGTEWIGSSGNTLELSGVSINLNGGSGTGATTLKNAGIRQIDTNHNVYATAYYPLTSTTGPAFYGYGGTQKIIDGVSGATYFRASGTSTLCSTHQAGQIILASGLSYGAVNSYTQIINGSTGAISGTSATFSGSVGIGGNTPSSLLMVGDAGTAPNGIATISLTGPNTVPQIASKPGMYHRHSIGLGLYSDYKMTFEVDGATSLITAMTIDDDGQVGIGIDPKVKLEVLGGLNISNNNTGATTTTLRIGSYGASSQTYYGAKLVAYTDFSTSTFTDLVFQVGTVEAMKIGGNGDIGIGVYPACKLDVNGIITPRGNAIRLAGPTDGNHFLQKFTTGYSSYTIDGPMLQGHQGGELTTNSGGNEWALRWATGGKVYINNQLEIGTVGVGVVGLGVYTSGGSTTPNVRFGRNANEYIGFKVEDRVNTIVFRQDETTGNHSAHLDFWSSTNGNKTFRIRESDQSGNLIADRVIIENGDVGIGGEPSTKFHVKGTVEETIRLESGASGAMHFFNGSTRAGILGYTNGSTIMPTADANDMILRAEGGKKVHLSIGSAGGATLTSTGFGIGTTSPSHKLTIGSGQSNYIRLHNAASGDVSSGILIERGTATGLQIYDNPADNASTFLAEGMMNFRTNGSQRLRIDTNGDAEFAQNIAIPTGKSIYFALMSDPNWRIGRNIHSYTNSIVTSNSIDILAHAGSAQGVSIGANNATQSSFEIKHNSDNAHQFFMRGYVGINQTATLANRKFYSGGGYYLSGGGYNSGGYTSDGLFGSTATPNVLQFSSGRRVLLGYTDNGSGLYAETMAIETHSTDGLGNTVEKNAFLIKNINSGSHVFTVTNTGSVHCDSRLQVNNTTRTDEALNINGSIKGVSSQGYTTFFHNDPYHGICLRGTPTAYNSTNMTPADVMSFMEYSGDFRFYQKKSNGTLAVQGKLYLGTWTVSGDVIAFGSPSDISLKENIKPINSALDKAMKLQGVTFDWKQKEDNILDIKQDIGFIAQDVQKVVPELVRKNNNGLLSLRHQGIAPILLEAIKELKAEVDSLRNEIKELKK